MPDYTLPGHSLSLTNSFYLLNLLIDAFTNSIILIYGWFIILKITKMFLRF